MESHDTHSSLSAVVLFVATALISSVLLIAALVLFLGEVIGSHLLAMVLVGGVCGVVSWLIYNSSLKPLVRGVEEQITTIYEVAYGARRAYEWTVEYIMTRVLK